MRALLFTFLIAALAGPASAAGVEPGTAASVDPAMVLAEWNDGVITVQDYVDWWKLMPEGDRDTLDTAEAKTAFLENMINARLMLAEAESLGISEHEDMQQVIKRREFSIVSMAMLDRAMASAPPPDEDEVEKIYEEQLTQVNVRRIMVEKRAEADALMDSIAAGIPFEDLAYRHSTDVTGRNGGFLGTLRRAELEEPWQTQIFRLEAGEVSDPFYTERGWAIVKVETKAIVEPPDPEAARRGIRDSIVKRHMFAEQAAYLDSLRIAYDLQIYADAVIGLCSEYALALARLGDRTAVVSEDVVPDLSGDEKGTLVAGFTGWTFTYEDVVSSILAQPYPTRPILDDPESMIGFVGRQVKDTLLVAEAEKLGAYEWPEVKSEVERAVRRRTATRVYRMLTGGAEVPQDSIRARYDRYKEYYIMPAGHTASKMVLPTRSAADSIMAMLEAGASFEELAMERSIDPFSAPNGGDLGFMALGQDEEFDIFFESMQVGETRYFRSLEGHVILRLRERHEERLAAYEEAEASIRRDLLDHYKDLKLEEWLAAERESRGMKVYSDRLEPISLVP
ncbi:MAG: peptidylprolyl isomerase [bacterium]|jgi:parvulin-like peptidyl-prolyl isomerase